MIREAAAGAREQVLYDIERRRLQSLLVNLDSWWPVFEAKHPGVGRADTIRKLVGMLDRRPASALKGLQELPEGRYLREELMPVLEPWRSIRELFRRPLMRPTDAIVEGGTACTASYGLALGSGFTWIELESPSLGDTQAIRTAVPLGTEGWDGCRGAAFWTGFSRLDSWLDDIDILSGSTADRVKWLGIVSVSLPAPACNLTARFVTTLFVHLPNGVQIQNNWGGLDDTDFASMKIELCSAVQPAGSAIPAPQSFSYLQGMHYTQSRTNPDWAEGLISMSIPLTAGMSPTVFLGIRVTMAGADCKIQTGFEEGAHDAKFGFRYPDSSGSPGLFFSYEP